MSAGPTETESSRHFIVSRPVAILMVALAAVVFGYLSLGQLPVTLMPELTYPTLTVRTTYPGAAPEDDGFVLCTVYDGASDTSHLAVLDAANVEAEPVATAHLEHRIPLGFHGNFAAGVV